MLACPSCGASNESGRKFCGECGTRLAQACRACGTANPATARFCGECGSRLEEAAGAGGPVAVPTGPAGPPTTERRLVSVLFADLVGFTTRSDGHDPEAVREFLARYFDVAREIVERYGGQVEKFIGDAVMAVWGTPVAQEDDAERAVRAGLDLVDAVRQLGRQVGDDALELRVAVMTGEAAVSLGAVGQGMVAGDLVNTASRLQAVAPPGAVLVGEATHRAASRAILFEPAGEHLLRGKSAPVQAWRAQRVVAERGGQGRTEGPEAPFVGRDNELRLLKDVYHATAREGRARLISVTGQAGIGKSRLAWEFLKYIDGLLESVNWHQGRSPAYGEGVTFWALGEMVRRRAKLVEGDDEATTRERIAAALVEYVPDADERRWIEPALLSLLGVGDPPAGGRDALFAAWRTFIERVSADAPAIFVFEDLQWADGGLLDFIDHLLEWSRNHPILVVTLARPELLERRPDWGAGRRNFVALSLEPLPEPAMRDLLAGLVPGLPEQAVRAILDRADGVPLYAVETVRMLVAEGKVEATDGGYRPIGDVSQLAVPDSLHALIAARLDALESSDRTLLQDASVLGQSFSVAALAGLIGEPAESLEPRLRGLVRREMLTLDTHPRSPERGQYGFTQGLIREVAYSTLARRDRRTRHLAAARHYEAVGDEELAAILANHYFAAWEASPEGPEGEAVAAQARVALRAAADRAGDLGSHAQATALLRMAIAVTPDPVEAAELLERTGVAARMAGRFDEAETLLRDAVERHRARHDRIGVARATAELGSTILSSFRTAEAMAILEPAAVEFADLADEPAGVALSAQVARAYFFHEEIERANALVDLVLARAERLDLVDLVADLLVTRGVGLAQVGRAYEGLGTLEAGRRLSEERGLVATARRAEINITGVLGFRDPRAAVEMGRRGLEEARRLGLRAQAGVLAGNTVEACRRTGDWDVADAVLATMQGETSDVLRGVELTQLIPFEAYRGRPTEELMVEFTRLTPDDTDAATRADFLRAQAAVAFAEGRLDEAHDDAFEAAEISLVNGPHPYAFAARAALWAHDRDRVRRCLEHHEASGHHGPAIELERVTMRAGLAALDGRTADALALYRDAWRGWREIGCRFDLALAELDAVLLLDEGGSELAEARSEAHDILERLEANSLLRTLDAPREHANGAPKRRVPRAPVTPGELSLESRS